MAITYNDRIKTWKLDTPNTSYIIGVVDEKYLAHIYYGARVEDDNLSYLLRPEEIVPPSIKPEEQLGFMDFVQLEYPCQGDYGFSSAKILDQYAGGRKSRRHHRGNSWSAMLVLWVDTT